MCARRLTNLCVDSFLETQLCDDGIHDGFLLVPGNTPRQPQARCHLECLPHLDSHIRKSHAHCWRYGRAADFVYERVQCTKTTPRQTSTHREDAQQYIVLHYIPVHRRTPHTRDCLPSMKAWRFQHTRTPVWLRYHTVAAALPHSGSRAGGGISHSRADVPEILFTVAAVCQDAALQLASRKAPRQRIHERRLARTCRVRRPTCGSWRSRNRQRPCRRVKSVRHVVSQHDGHGTSGTRHGPAGVLNLFNIHVQSQETATPSVQWHMAPEWRWRRRRTCGPHDGQQVPGRRHAREPLQDHHCGPLLALAHGHGVRQIAPLQRHRDSLRRALTRCLRPSDPFQASHTALRSLVTTASHSPAVDT